MNCSTKKILFFLFATIQYSFAQDIRFEHITNEDGLSQSVVNCILQDKYGMIWIGTEDGLNMYNAYEFKIYKSQEGKPGTISGNVINCLFIDKNNRLWAGLRYGGLNLYNREQDNWISYNYKFPDKDSIVNLNIECIENGKNGTLLIGTHQNGLHLFFPDSGIFEKIKVSLGSSSSYAKRIKSLYFSPEEDILWLGTREQLLRYSFTSKKTISLPFFKNDQEISINSTVMDVFKDTYNNLWVATEFSGLFVFDRDRERMQKYELPFDHESRDNIHDLLEDRNNNIWIGFDGAGLGKLNLGNGAFSNYQHVENDISSLSNNSVYSIFESKDGILWVGNYGGALNVYNKNKNKFKLYKHNSSKPGGLGNDNVRSIYEDGEGIIWLGTRKGIDKYSPETGTFQHYFHETDNPTSLSANIVLSIYEDSYDNFWVGTFSGGLNLLDRETGKFRVFSHDKTDPKSISNDCIYSIFEDSEKNLWIGTLSRLNKLDRKSMSFIQYPITVVKSILEDSQNRLYLGTGNGLLLFDRQTGDYNKLWPIKGHNSHVLTITEDKNQNIWIGTKGKGLIKLTKTLKLVKTYTELDGMPNNIINSIIEDKNGSLWISTNKGITRFDPEKETFRNFDISDGLQGNEFNANSGIKSSDGHIYFGGINGLNIFKPNKIPYNQEIPNVLITGFELLNQPDKTINKSPLNKNISVLKKIDLKHSQSSFTFNYVALNYTAPEKNQYKYILEGFDEHWNNVGTRRTATYTNIPHGEYTFRVMGSNNDLIWNEESANINISISPPLWKTWYAKTFYILLFISLIILFNRYALIRVAVKNKLLLQRIENQKREELYQMKLAFFTNISHEFRTPLTLIAGPLEKLIKGQPEGSALRKQYALMLKNASRLLMLINQLMDFRKIDMDKMQLKLKEGNICNYIKETAQAFESLAQERNINFNFFTEKDKIISWFDPDAIDKIMHNLLSNAFKFTPDNSGEISVLVTISRNSNQNQNRRKFIRSKTVFENYIQVVVKDNGVGIEKDAINRIFDRFYTRDNFHAQRTEGTGIGLALTKSLVELHMGSIWVESEKGNGSLIYFKIPIILKPFNTQNSNIIFDRDEPVEHSPKQVKIEPPDNGVKKTQQLIAENDDSTIVLIVEDNPDLLEFIKSNLNSSYRFLEASNGHEGYELAIKSVPDIIVSDVMMPVMDGIEFSSKIKTNVITSHIPIILLTAKATKEHKIEGFKTGADDYITKPFDPEILNLRIENLLQTRAKLKEVFSKEITLEPTQTKITSHDEKLIQRLLDALEKNLENVDFGVSELVKVSGMSRPVLYRKVKALTGLTVVQFINIYKLKKAAHFLSQKKISVSEVAYAVGFNDPKYFSKCFTKHYGLTPKEYAAQIPD